MSEKNPIFWTDAQQAAEKLQGSYILLEKDPLYVERIRNDERGAPEIRGYLYPKRTAVNVKLDDPRLHRFRVLPPVGWVNYKERKAAVYLSRRPRRTRIHGLTSENVTVSMLNETGNIVADWYRLDNIVQDEGYLLACNNDYPELEEVLQHLKENSSLALSSVYAVHRDKDGVRWLFRNTDKVGLFSGVGTLYLFSRFSFLREEMNEVFKIDIKEF